MKEQAITHCKEMIKRNNNIVKEAKAHLGWLLDSNILTNEDDPHIQVILEYIKRLEENTKLEKQKLKNKLMKYFDIGYSNYYRFYIDDFIEFDEDTVDDIVEYIYKEEY